MRETGSSPAAKTSLIVTVRNDREGFRDAQALATQTVMPDSS